MKDGKSALRDRSFSHVISVERKEISNNSNMLVFGVRIAKG